MANEDETSDTPATLGLYLKSVRESKGLSLRNVEEATEKEVSNAYLSQLENDKISRPSPHVLHTLSAVYAVSYEKLMERAGYLAPSGARRSGEKHGRAATRSIESLTTDEEKELLKYLSWYRARAHKDKTKK